MPDDPGYDLNLFATADGGLGVSVVDLRDPVRKAKTARWTAGQLAEIQAHPEAADPPPVWEALQ